MKAPWIRVFAILVILHLGVCRPAIAELVELTTTDGCFAYVNNVEPGVVRVEWTGACIPGRPIEGSGALKVLYNNGYWFEMSGPFSNGATNGQVRFRSAREKDYGEALSMFGGCFAGHKNCTSRPARVGVIPPERSASVSRNAQAGSTKAKPAMAGSDKQFKTHSCSAECASAYSVDFGIFTHYYNDALTATLYAGDTYEIKRDAWCSEIIRQDSEASLGEIQDFISGMKNSMAKGGYSMTPAVQTYFDYKECMLQNKLGNRKKDFAGSTQEEIFMACNKQMNAAMHLHDTTSNDPITVYRSRISAYNAMNKVLQNDPACKALKSKDESIQNNRRIIKEYEMKIIEIGNQRSTPKSDAQDCRAGNPYIPKNTCQ